MRIAWVSNPPWATSGYGVQTDMILDRMIQHEVCDPYCVASCGLGFGEIPWKDYTVVSPQHPAECDAIISFIDAHAYDPSINTRPWVPWLIVDRDPLPPLTLKRAQQANMVLTCSKFGQSQLDNNGVDSTYIPCAYDPENFSMCDKAQARELIGMDQDCFWIGIVADNRTRPSRKNILEQVEAFARFSKKHDDARLFLHSVITTARQGEDVSGLIKYLGIESKVLVSDQTRLMSTGYPVHVMEAIYNAIDVLSLVSADEGFGVPLIEAQACGTPVITGGWTAMAENCLCGWTIPKEDAQRRWAGGYQYVPIISAIVEKYEQAYRYASGMRGHVVSEIEEKFAIDNVFTTHWIPALKEIERRVGTAAVAAELEKAS